MVFKSKRYLSCVLIAAMLICAVPISVYAETGQILSEDDRDAKSTAGWVGEFDPRNDFDFINTSPETNWYQNIDISQYNIISPTDSIDGTRDTFEYCPFYNTKDNSKSTIYKDYVLNTPGYFMLSASGEIALQFSNDTGMLKVEVYDNTAGTGSPISSSSASAQYKTGDWDTVSINDVYLTPRAKMIRLVLEAVTEVIDENDYIDFDGLNVSLALTAAPPIITNMNNDSVVFTKSGPPIPLDKDQDVTVKVDSGFGRTYEGGSLIASITNNGIASEDVLEIAQTGGITLSGGSVLYNETPIGTYSAGGSEMNLSVSLNADADDISVAALIKAIVYRNTNTVNPNTTPRTVMVSVSDNNNASEPVFTTVNVNDPPVRKSGVPASDTSDMTVNSPYSLDLNTIFEDTNGDPLSYKVKVNEEAEQSTGNIYSYTPTGIGTYTLVFHAYDGNDESTDIYTVILNVKVPNTPPVRKSGVSDTKLETIAVNKACEINLDTIFEDADGDSLTYAVSVNGGEEKAVDGDYSYTPASQGVYTLEFRAYDGSAYSTDTCKVNITAVNTPPVRKSNVEESVNESLTVGMAYTLDLTEIFEDENQDLLTYKVKVSDNAEEIISKDYTFTPAATGSYTLVFKANDGIDDSNTYTVTLNVKQPNRAPVRKSGVKESMSFTSDVNSQFYIGLDNVFVDPDDDPLTFMVKIDDNPEVSADDNFNYTVTSAGSHTLVFKASDGRLESTETFTISITATKIPLRSVTQPDAVTGIPNGSAKTAAALGLPETVRIVTASGLENADVTWNVAACSYDPDQESEQTFDVEGTVSIPDYISNPDGISLDVTVRVTVKSKLPADMTLVSIVPVTPITGIPNGSAKTILSLNLPPNVFLVTDQGNISAGVTWDLDSSSYGPDLKTAQTFEVEGVVSLPAKVVNPDGVSLSVTVEVTVDAESLTDKTLERIYSISPLKGITSGTAKTVTALGLPAKVLLGTDDGTVQAEVIWDLDSSSYDPDISEEQTFTVDGTIELPDNVINPAGISLDVTVEVTVLEEEEEQEYYTLRIKVTKRPDKVSYTLGEDLDTQGLEVTEYQKASPSNAVRKVALSEGQYDLEYNLARTGTRHVKVIYYGTDRNGDEKEFKDEFTVRVKEPPRDDSSDDDDDDRENISPGWKSTGGDQNYYYPSTWNKDDTGWRLSGKDGSRVANRWVYTDWLDSKDWYFFDEKGYMVTGWFDYKGNVYYLNPVSDGTKGSMCTGWNMIEGKWYYFSEAADGTKGSMLKNTETPDGHRVGPDGVRIS